MPLSMSCVWYCISAPLMWRWLHWNTTCNLWIMMVLFLEKCSHAFLTPDKSFSHISTTIVLEGSIIGYSLVDKTPIKTNLKRFPPSIQKRSNFLWLPTTSTESWPLFYVFCCTLDPLVKNIGFQPSVYKFWLRVTDMSQSTILRKPF